MEFKVVFAKHLSNRIIIEYGQHGYGDGSLYVKGELPEYTMAREWKQGDRIIIKCCNPRCNACYDLTFRVEKFSERKDDMEIGGIVCQGVVKNGRRDRKICANTLSYKIYRAPDVPKNESESEHSHQTQD